MTIEWKAVRQQALSNVEVKAEYDALIPEFNSARKAMQESLYYISNRNANNELLVLCKNKEWRLYRECEEDWTQVLLLSSKDAYDLQESLLTKDDKYGFTNCQIYVKNESNRSSYALLRYHELPDSWQLIGKCIANSWGEACRSFSVDITRASYSDQQRVSHCSDLHRYDDGIAEAFDSLGVTH